MNWNVFLIVGLTYLIIGFGSALLLFNIMKKQVPGGFWGALIVGCIGSFLGGVIYQAFPAVFNRLADFNDVNVYAAMFTAIILVWLFSKLSSGK